MKTKYEIVNTHGDYTVEVDGLIVATATSKEEAIKFKQRFEDHEASIEMANIIDGKE